MTSASNDADCSMILVMGVTGSGKSYFINKLSAGAVVEGSGLRSETEHCQVVRVGVGRNQVAVVDTPGFDDTERSDADIVEQIVDFLCYQYELGIPLKGIVYLHKITDNKVSGTARRYFEIFTRLCGDQALSNVILVTTMWDDLRDEGLGLSRERELRKDFWNEMESKGAITRRFDGSRAMAESFLCRLMRKADVVLAIQNQLVDQGRSLEDTDVGHLLVPRLQQHIGEIEETIKDLDELTADGDSRLTAEERSRLDSQKLQLQQLRGEELSRRQKLRKRPGTEAAAKIENARRSGKWKSRISLFASLLGLAITTTVNIILPLAGVIAF